MITLKRYLIERDEKIILQLSLDTEPSGYLSDMDRFFSGEFVIRKTWMGNVDRKTNSFRVRRTKVGIFKTLVSMTEISGHVTQNQENIEIKLRLTWYTTAHIVWAAAILAFFIYSFFNDFAGWTVFAGLVMIQVLFLNLDFRKTDGQFVSYIDHIRNIRRQQEG